MKKIIYLLLALIILGSITGCGKNKNTKEKSWKEIYFNHITDKEQIKNHNFNKNTKIGFIESENYKEPIMYTITDYKREDSTFNELSFYGINEKNEVVGASFINEGEHSIELMYHIPTNSYMYFMYEKYNNMETYSNIEPEIKHMGAIPEEKVEEYKKERNQNAMYYIKTGNTYRKQTAPEGELIAEENQNDLISTNIKQELVNYSDNKKELKKNFNKLIEKYKTIKEQVTSKVEKEVEKQKEEITKLEEEQKKPEETPKSNNDGVKVGDYTLKYGKYNACIDVSGGPCSEFTLNADGTCTYDGEACTYTIVTRNFKQRSQAPDRYHPAISFNKSDGTVFNLLTPYDTGDGCLLTDGDLTCGNYIG